MTKRLQSGVFSDGEESSPQKMNVGNAKPDRCRVIFSPISESDDLSKTHSYKVWQDINVAVKDFDVFLKGKNLVVSCAQNLLEMLCN